MAFGELVGDAYVRIHADTTFMRRAIRDAAERDAKDYEKTFSNSVESMAAAEFAKNRNRLAKAVALQDFSSFRRQFGGVQKAVEAARAEMEELVREGRIYANDVKVIENSLKKWAVRAQLSEDIDKAHEAALRHEEGLRKLQVAAERANKEFDRQVQLGERLAAQAEKNLLKKITKDWEAFSAALARNNVQLDRNRDLLVRSGVDIKELALQLSQGNSTLSKASTRVDKFNIGLVRIGDGVGRAFGKGSRNNFLNFFGTVVGGLAKLPALLVGTFSKVIGSVGGLVDKFKALRASGSSVAGALALTLGRAAMTGVGALVALAAAIVSAGIAIPALTSGLLLLAGAITAVVGAISVGLVGGLLAAGPAIVALGLGVAAVIPLWSQLGTIMEKGSEKLYPGLVKLKSAMTDLREQTEKNAGAFTKAFSATFAPLIRGTVIPLFGLMQQAALTLVTHFDTLFNRPAMQKFLNVWETSLPRAFLSIGRGINNMLAGFTAFFAPILPYAEKLASNFNMMMLDFRLWAEDAGGQNAIKDFMEKAWTAAQDLWTIIENLAVSLGKVFFSGTEGAGQSFLTYLADVTTRFREWLDTPEGQEAMKTFWADVRDVMLTVKDILEDLGDTIDNLDTEQARQDFETFMGAASSVAGAIEWMSRGLSAAGTLFKTIISVTSPVIVGFNVLSTVVDRMGGTFDVVWAGIKLGIATAASAVFSGVAWMVETFLTLVSTIINGAAKAFGWVPGLGPKLETAAAEFQTFKDNTNASLAKVKTDLEMNVKTAEAELAIARLKFKLDGLKNKSIVVTTIGRFVNPEQLPGGGRGTAGGLTLAAGGIAAGPMRALIGEAGPEAVVPLNRPLSQVDPAVRELSAFAQGLRSMARGGAIGGGRTINISPGAIVVNSPLTDPALIAEAVFDRIVQYG